MPSSCSIRYAAQLLTEGHEVRRAKWVPHARLRSLANGTVLFVDPENHTSLFWAPTHHDLRALDWEIYDV